MGTRTIRFLDYWLGVPLCLLLTACRWLVAGAAGPAAEDPVPEVHRTGRHGAGAGRDAAGHRQRRTRQPLLLRLREQSRHPRPARHRAAGQHLCHSRRRLDLCLLDFLRALIAIRSRRVDTVIDMEFFSRASAIFSFLSGATTRVGLHRFTGELPYRGDLMTHRVQYNPHVHVSLQYAVLVEAAHRDPAETPLLKVPLAQIARRGDAAGAVVPIHADRRRNADASGGCCRQRRGPVVLINPNASDLLPLRKWEGARFVELSRRILAAYPIAGIVVTGAPSEGPGAAAGLRGDRVATRDLAGGQDDAARAADALQPGRRARHQRQRTGPLRLAHAGPYRRAVWSRNAAAVRIAVADTRRSSGKSWRAVRV